MPSSDPPSTEESFKKPKIKKSKLDRIADIQEEDCKKKEKKRKKEKREEKGKGDTRFDDDKDKKMAFEVEVEATKERKKKKGRKRKRDAMCRDGDNDTKMEEVGGREFENLKGVGDFRITEVLKDALKSEGIERLFPIQAMTFDIILDGSDLVGCARTGQGKTLAFVLPILESLVNEKTMTCRKTGNGKQPTVLVLLPSRELSNQVFVDFEFYGGLVGLTACCLYGGSPYASQNQALQRGVDIIVGTPERIKDHVDRGTLKLESLKFCVLDAADEMLKTGFVDDVELILGMIGDANKIQRLLFSATFSDWVKKLSSRFLNHNKKTVDLAGKEKLKATARRLALPCSRKARGHVIQDIIHLYSQGKRTIVFTDTNDSASELSGLLHKSHALHGDIAQMECEAILSGFRSGRFLVLVATNVVARGLDIHNVQLIIQCEPPQDVKAFMHRSELIERAGNSGVTVLLYEPKNSHVISLIENQFGVKFERINAPQPVEVAQLSGKDAALAISHMPDSVIPVFQSQAEHLLASSKLSPVDFLAKALAKVAGYTDVKNRSLLSSLEGHVALILQTETTMYSSSFALSFLKRYLPDDKIRGIKGLKITAGGTGAVFDVPTDDVELFTKAIKNAKMMSIEELREIPPLRVVDRSNKAFGDKRGGRRAGRSGRGR
ncbi:DEAD-box ATP-dependent RNA helicase 7 [Zostera marina]|uniref:RNA helicase n=1 Tax=Zostera marina TaxID=29655 RepID=A0A0K9NNH2_ZOSMR|nr:DEAD-box ATP-dependent RNA helicase 7 [Zostera marina]